MNVYINDCVRTTRGKARPGGGLANETPESLVAALVGSMEGRGRLDRKEAEHLALGCVGQVGAQGGHIALIAKIAANLPAKTTAHTINNFCVSGLTAIGSAAASVEAGHNRIALAGGVEMLSRVPFMADKADYYIAENFTPRDSYIPVALAADILADDENISRSQLDELAFLSQTRAAAADADSALQASRINIGGIISDEAIRPTNMDSLARLEPAFSPLAKEYRRALGDKEIEHRLTVAHAPPMADGAGLAAIGSPGAFLNPRARIVAYGESGGDPRQSLLAGIAAMKKVLTSAELTLDDMDRIEFMEAFATPVAIFKRDWKPDMNKVNVGGGHIAKGHPMGATGAILLSTLMDALDAAAGKYGLVVTSGAQGAGAAMIIERL